MSLGVHFLELLLHEDDLDVGFSGTQLTDLPLRLRQDLSVVLLEQGLLVERTRLLVLEDNQWSLDGLNLLVKLLV